MEVSNEIVSNYREDEPLIFISNRAISLYNDNKILKAKIDKAIEFMEKRKIENDKMINFEIQHDEYEHEDAEAENGLIDELLDILIGEE